MRDQTRKRFKKRAFVALAAAFCALGLPVSGVANHLFQLDPMGVQRHAWMSAHNILGAMFVVFSLWHGLLNRRALLKYAGGLAGRLPGVSREAACAAAVVTTMLVLAVGHGFILGD